MAPKLRKAGQALGFDLASLFSDEEDRGGLEPFFKVGAKVKGRGGTLSYKAPKEPYREYEAGLMPSEDGGVNVNVTQSQSQDDTISQTVQPPAPPAPPAPEPEPSISYTDPGDQGYFGMKDYDELMAQGLTREQIGEYATSRQYGVGPVASQVLGVKPYTETQGVSTQFPITTAESQQTPRSLEGVEDQGDKGWFGMKDYDYMKGLGFLENQIKAQAEKSQYGIGEEAASKLGLQGGAKYTFTDPGDKGAFGMKDYDELAGQGVGEEEIRRVARGFGTIGTAARQKLGI